MKQNAKQKKKNSDFQVEFPPKNDGPIFHLLVSGNTTFDPLRVGRMNRFVAGLGEAQSILLSFEEAVKDIDIVIEERQIRDNKADSIEILSNQLLVQLCTCHQVTTRDKPSLRQQLASLRTYKNGILKVIEASNNQSNENREENESSSLMTIGIYRILIELCLSCDTPHAFKRAGYSCLSALLSYYELVNEKNAVKDLHVSIIESILCPIKESQFWRQPIQTLFDAFTYDPIKDLIVEKSEYIDAVLRLALSEGSTSSQVLKNTESTRSFGLDMDTNNDNLDEGKQSRTVVVGLDILDAIERNLQICSTLKSIFTPIMLDIRNSSRKKGTLILYNNVIDTVVKPLMYCPATSTDALIVGGVCYSQLLTLKWGMEAQNNQSLLSTAYEFFLEIIGCNLGDSILSFQDLIDGTINSSKAIREHLPNVLVLRGLVSVLSTNILAISMNDIQSNNNEPVFLIDRIASYMMALCQHSSNDAIRLWALKGLETIMGRSRGIVLSSKSEPEFNEFSKHAKALADEILKLSLIIFDSPPCKQIGSAVPGLFQSLVNLIEVLDDQQHEEHKYSNDVETKSMDVLVMQILTQPNSRKGKYVALDALLYKVGASKLLEISESIGSEGLVSSFIQEISERGNSAGAVAELLGKILSLLRNEMHASAGVDLNRDGESKKERRIREKNMAKETEKATISNDDDDVRLLPGWFDVWVRPLAQALIFSKPSRQSHIASYCLPLIMTVVGGNARKTDACHSFAAVLDEIRNIDTDSKNLLWAKLEIVRQASQNKLFRSGLSNAVLCKAVSDAVSFDEFKGAMVHESPKIRVVAYQTIGDLIPLIDRELQDERINSILREIALWQQSLPYAFNCSEREHMLYLNDALKRFLVRIADIEAASNKFHGNSILLKFVDFLLRRLFLSQAYPGTTSQKESFSLRMLDVVITFASQTKLDKKTTQKHAFVMSDIRAKILSSLVSDDVVATLLSLVYSMWDATRISAFDTTCKVINLAKEHNLSLPLFLFEKRSRDSLSSRAVHLASSPRQREADTGARLLAILCLTLNTKRDQYIYQENISIYLQDRLKLMETALGVVLNPDNMNAKEEKPSLSSAFELPLAHGIIQALKLIVNDVIKVEGFTPNARTFCDLTKLFCRAIEVSLVVVADVNDDVRESEGVTSSDMRWKAARGNKNSGTPLNVNTGALGANAFDENDSGKKMIMQRILIGSWLLTKEACAALSAVVTASSKIDSAIISTAGDLLISTLTTLKHQGAAFAAHKALQSLCSKCFIEADENDLRSLPSMWSQRLLDEISSSEIVRDSTLRRSTGYGLGFLSILRPEPNSGPKYLFQNTLSSIIRYSLPAKSKMDEYMAKWRYSSSKNMLSYPFFLSPETMDFVEDKEYECRTRIHAQNILRLITLDAPLALEMRKFVGDSIISALIGYTDTSWAIRNSATMTFSAAMLRVVDPDKNSEAKLKCSKNVSGISAISASELFRSYPSLAPILLAIIKEERDCPTSNDAIHPVLFPLLLMLSRLQPISMSQVDPSADQISMMFIDPVISCLGHVHHKVRLVAARALNVLCSGDDDDAVKSSTRRNLIMKCTRIISGDDSMSNCHNRDHGVLMALKCLLESCKHPHKYFDRRLQNILIQFASWGYFKATCSPSCTAVALEIWCCIYKSFENDFDLSRIIMEHQGRTLTILDVLSQIVICIEKITAASSHYIIGVSTLGSTAAKVAVEILFPHVASNDDQSIHFWGHIQNLMCSEVFDIATFAVKSFKKKMRFLLESDTTNLKLSRILKHACRIIFQSLLFILSRDGISAHPPTLRRITRVLLETVTKYRSLSGDQDTSHFGACSINEIFHRLSDMLTLDTKANSIGTNVGNMLELISLTIPELCNLYSMDSNPIDFQSHLDLFVNQVLKFSDSQTEDWKQRLSAAISIRESRLLVYDANSTCMFGDVVKKYKIELYFRAVQLLQDSDEDVRKIAASTLLESDSHLASLRQLEKGYSVLTKTFFNEPNLFTMLTKQITSQIRDLTPMISDIFEEYNASIGYENLSEVQNLSSKRKIFEEEDSNAFEESLLIIHISILKLLEISSSHDDKFVEDIGLYEELIQNCLEMIGLIEPFIQIIDRTSDFAHNIFWNSDLFAKVHGILLACAFAVYHYGIGADLIESTQKLNASTIFIHPLIEEAITALSFAKQKDSLTFQRLEKCCFLIPNSLMMISS